MDESVTRAAEKAVLASRCLDSACGDLERAGSGEGIADQLAQEMTRVEGLTRELAGLEG